MKPEIPSTLINTLRQARYIAVLTGAGISAESGVPTFRDAQTGLWTKYHPEDLATPEAFRRDPKLVWDWYEWRRELVAKAEPNAGHIALATLARHVPKLTLITQNIDGLHQRAGSRDVIELHGNLFRNKRLRDSVIVEHHEDTGETPPRCPQTGDLLRPDVVWFGEMLPLRALRDAQIAATNCDVFFSIGTSTLVQPAAELPFTALHNNAVVVEINPKTTPLSEHAHYSLHGAAGQILPLIASSLD